MSGLSIACFRYQDHHNILSCSSITCNVIFYNIYQIITIILHIHSLLRYVKSFESPIHPNVILKLLIIFHIFTFQSELVSAFLVRRLDCLFVYTLETRGRKSVSWKQYLMSKWMKYDVNRLTCIITESDSFCSWASRFDTLTIY